MWIRGSRCLSSPSSWRKIVESQRGTPGSLAIVFRRRSAAGGSARPAPHGDSVGPPSGWSGAKSGSSDRHRQLPTGTKRCSSRYGCDWSKSPRARPNSGLPTDSAERAGEHGDSLARREASRSAKGRKSCHSATRSSYRRQRDQPGLNERAAGSSAPGFRQYSGTFHRRARRDVLRLFRCRPAHGRAATHPGVPPAASSAHTTAYSIQRTDRMD
jgi:hypothetical protein